mmetsp:Transcript_109783/g.261747  ORF Transcript_109783/g.261747 Transcript_109783/m.261747 type:complete len:274 (+) Transcript_109783:738-1559(+)
MPTDKWLLPANRRPHCVHGSGRDRDPLSVHLHGLRQRRKHHRRYSLHVLLPHRVDHAPHRVWRRLLLQRLELDGSRTDRPGHHRPRLLLQRRRELPRCDGFPPADASSSPGWSCPTAALLQAAVLARRRDHGLHQDRCLGLAADESHHLRLWSRLLPRSEDRYVPRRRSGGRRGVAGLFWELGKLPGDSLSDNNAGGLANRHRDYDQVPELAPGPRDPPLDADLLRCDERDGGHLCQQRNGCIVSPVSRPRQEGEGRVRGHLQGVVRGLRRSG